MIYSETRKEQNYESTKLYLLHSVWWDSVYNLRRVLEQANDRISKSRRDRKYLLRTLRKEQDENARLKLEIERLKEVSEMWQTIATSSVTAGGELLDALENEWGSCMYRLHLRVLVFLQNAIGKLEISETSVVDVLEK